MEFPGTGRQEEWRHVPVFNEGALNSVEEMGGEELVVELLELFFTRLYPDLHTLICALLAADRDECIMLSHRLKSSCSQLGAGRLADLCRTVEASYAPEAEWREKMAETLAEVTAETALSLRAYRGKFKHLKDWEV